MENIRFKGLEASYYDVDSHVILVSSEQMGFRKVLANKIARSFWHVLLSAYYSDSSSAT